MIRELQFAAPQWLYLLWAAPLLLGLALYGQARRRRALAALGATPAACGAAWRELRRRRLLRALGVALAAALFAVAAAQPRGNPERRPLPLAARDLVVLVDVSRSMLAEDLAPNRLERAKLELGRLADALAGERVALVAFAGDAAILCPPTFNYSYFKQRVAALSPASANQGGTHLGDAVRLALADVLGLEGPERSEPPPGAAAPSASPGPEGGRPRGEFADLLVLSDGEDHDSFPARAAQSAAELGVAIFAVGLGSEAEPGAVIPVAGPGGAKTPLAYQGQPVHTRLDSATLYNLVAQAAPRGAYLPAGTDNFDLVDFYRRRLAAGPRRGLLAERVFWTEYFPFFVAAGCLCLLAGTLIGERPRAGALRQERGMRLEA